MARYVIDAPTLVHRVDAGLQVDPGHQLVAPNSIRSEALERLLRDVRTGQRTEAAALAAHERMTEIKLRLLGDRVSRRNAWEIARILEPHVARVVVVNPSDTRIAQARAKNA